MREPDDQRTRACINEETAYFNACMSSVSTLQDALYEELKARIVEDDVSVPETIEGYRYYTRVESGRQYPIHCRTADAGGEEEVYLDENLLAGADRYCEVALVSICPRQERVACAVDRTGGEIYEILTAPMPGGGLDCCARDAGDSIAWSRDGRHLIHTATDANARPDSVWSYDVVHGTRRRLYKEADPAFHVTVWTSRSGEWIFIDSASNSCSETRVIPAGSPFAEPAVVIARREEIEYTIDHHVDRFLILINDQGENFRLIAVPAPPDGGEREMELIPPDDTVSLEFVDAYRKHLVVGERRSGVKHIWAWHLESGRKRYLPGSGDLSCPDVEDLYDYDAGFVRYEYSTPVRPHSVYDFEPATGACTRRKTSRPPGYDEDDYVCERLAAPSGDVDVPLSLIYRADAVHKRDGTTPLLLTGYGAYEESVDTEFDSDLVSLLDRGIVVAMAHVRGGGDLGPGWHDAGRLGNKENSFNDFLSCAHCLIEQGYTGPGRIAAWGASAGGLLVAVAAHRQPRLFASVVLEVPFLDVINTLLDPDLPLTEYDFDEFGNPAVEEEYRWISGYSPYDNVSARAYPPMLVTAAMNDQRVGYWEALKWVARLRARKTDNNPLLLRIDDTGHLGESGRYGAVRDNAIVYTFLLDMWGIAQ